MAAPAAEAPKGTRILGVTLGHSQNMIFLTQVAFFCLYGGCTTFDGVYSHKAAASSTTADVLGGLAGGAGFLYHVFIGIFVFLGFGLLYIQNHKSPLQALGFTLSIAATTVEWAILLIGFWDNGKLTRTGAVSGWPPIPLNMTILLNALYIACTIVVSYGALVGRVSFGQAYAIAFFEVFFATANFKIMEELRVNDYGGTMFVHFFGATFGLFASMVIRTAPVNFTTNSNRARDVSVFGLLGTIVLFILYPVFNTGNLGSVVARNLNNVAAPSLLALNFRGYFNTVAAMASSVASSYMLSRANSVNGDKFTIWQIQTAAVAGGAAIAATAPMLRNPWGALMTGSIVGILATVSQTLVAPLLAKIRMFDATGVFASHWVPGFVGIFASAIAVARVTSDEDFAASQISALVLDGRTAVAQGGTQCAFGLITFGIALIGGIFTGLIVNLPIFEPKDTTSLFDEEEFAGLTGAQGAAPVQPAAAKVAEPAAAPAPAPAAAEPEAAAVAPKVDAAAEPAATA